MTFEEWNNKLKDNNISRLYLTNTNNKTYLNYTFGEYGKVHVEIPDKYIDAILEKLYKRELEFNKTSFILRLSCRCWKEDYENLYDRFQNAFNVYSESGNIDLIVNEINSYIPKYKPNCQFTLPVYSYVLLTCGNTNFLQKLFSRIKAEDTVSLAMQSSSRLNRWFNVDTEFSFGIGKVRIICNLGINILNYIGAEICSRYDKFYKHSNDYNFDEREDKIKEIIKDFSYYDLIKCLSKTITALQPVQVQCGGAPMYDHTDHAFVKAVNYGL